jgi:hypothetical protein
MLELKGNIYQPFKEVGLIEMVRLYFNPYIEDEDIQDERRSIKYEFSVDPETKMMESGTMLKTDFDQLNKVEKNAPSSWYMTDQDGVMILDEKGIPVLGEGTFFIEGSNEVIANTYSQYKLNFIDVDDEDHFVYIWNVLSGNATIQQNNQNPITMAFGEPSDVVLQAQIVDHRGNVSNYTTKTIQVR